MESGSAAAGVERWQSMQDNRECPGCRFLDGLVFPAGEGPRPPLHAGCRCFRWEVSVAGADPVERIRLALEARANARRGDGLLAEARRLAAESRVGSGPAVL